MSVMAEIMINFGVDLQLNFILDRKRQLLYLRKIYLTGTGLPLIPMLGIL